MKYGFIDFAAVLLTALVMGVFWGTWFTLTRSLSGFSPDEFIHIGKTIIANVAMPMRLLMPVTLLVLLLAVWLNRKSGKIPSSFYGLAFLLMAVTLVITVGVEVPIDNQIKTWSGNNLPSNWKELRTTWDKFHTLRTFTSLAALCVLTAGI